MKIDYTDMVKTLAKPGADIQASLTPEKCNLWHHATGIVGEAGELIDAIKKHVIYNKPIDLQNVIEELGDIEFYMEGIRRAMGVSRQNTLDYNIEKLSKRYEGLKYTDHGAAALADKAI